MRIGILGLLHESNTFLAQLTELENFAEQSLLDGPAIADAYAATPHEIGGFFTGLAQLAQEATIEIVPLFVARALPSGTVSAACWDELMRRMFEQVELHPDLDGYLVAPHGATVSDAARDADGDWLSRLRTTVGPEVPIVGTFDAHANLSPAMVDSCTALIGYRTNPHLDQHARGVEAADLLVRTVRGEIAPTMHAAFPPLAINIERQLTSDPHLQPLYALADQQLAEPRVLSNSIVLGFPYADVAEMGSSVVVVTDNDPELAARLARELADELWSRRESFAGQFVDIESALDRAQESESPVCLLDMGDNVGGGSAADGTFLAHAIHERQTAQAAFGSAFVCLFDPECVRQCERAGAGARLSLQMGAKTDAQHGTPLEASAEVLGLHDGKFRESQVRHGGFSEFDQGPTAVVRTDSGLTVMLTSRRMVPFSLEQLRSCELDPAGFRFLVAKGVNAPVAAYAEVCRTFVRVNTPGSTCADMTQLTYQNRRQPLFPFERDALRETPG